MYPKKDGIGTPASSAIDFTMKLGAFPMYVLAPMNTDPVAIACRKAWFSAIKRRIASCSGTPGYSRPRAVDRNVRYVGALSRNDDRPPLAQKNCAGARTAWTTNAKA